MKNKGFTLIELLVTMGIVAVLSGLAVFNFNQARLRARDVQRKSDLSQLTKALELYKNDHGSKYLVPDLEVTGPDSTLFQSALLDDGYIKTNFVDPKGTAWGKYQYLSSDGKTYYLMACLENTADTTKAEAAKCILFQPNGVNPSGTNCLCGESYKGVMYVLTNP